MNPKIRPMTPEDRRAILEIYKQGIETRNATFETVAPSWQGWDEAHLAQGRLVASVGDRVAGWAALCGVSDRCVYAGVADCSIYLDPQFHGKGIGKILLKALVEESEKLGLWTLQAGIFPENEASLRLHRAVGFREVGRRERLGEHHGEWRDVILMERRSSRVGGPKEPATRAR